MFNCNLSNILVKIYIHSIRWIIRITVPGIDFIVFLQRAQVIRKVFFLDSKGGNINENTPQIAMKSQPELPNVHNTDTVKEIISSSDVVVFMKGTPDQPQVFLLLYFGSANLVKRL